MKMRAPAIPLITVDPYFSVWSRDEHLNYTETVHWTGSPNSILGYVTVDGEKLAFLGYHRNDHKIRQTSINITALSTVVTYETDKIELKAVFTTPLLPDDPALMSRPVSYLALSYRPLDGAEHDVSAELRVYEDICLNKRRESPVVLENAAIAGIPAVRMGNSVQNVLNRSGDDVRIDWGYFYLAVKDSNAKVTGVSEARSYVRAEAALNTERVKLFMLAYDDIYCISYFGDKLKSAWNRDGKTIETAISEAAAEYDTLIARCDAFSADMYEKAEAAGGRKYAEMVTLAYRQVIAAHKIAVDNNGEILFISKECFSNGCAATVDVSYPSMPMLLYYNPELVRGMMRPIYRFAASDKWKFDFAPHDAGQYPLVEGQVYGLDRATGELKYEKQMPVEECGNMLVMEANVALAEGNADFAASHIDTLVKWCEYLLEYGTDPGNQLCTDDFAGHLAHNCNLSVKAVMGIEGMSIITNMLGRRSESVKYHKAAVEMARKWCSAASNGDGSYRLAFDQPDTYSMKYNMVWDKIWGTNIFPKAVMRSEIKSNFSRFNEFGMPLDSRTDYTKSDWLVWCATMCESRRDFEKFIAPLWKFFDSSPSRVPMTDWYDTVSARGISFQHRSVQGGLFIRLLHDSQLLCVKGHH